ncbi:MAG TPA: aspartate 1-decarboxylase [Thermoleophilaceae bacterium]|nr:aspartate 1-decarboxylase [Thermoleophilaceae bacterium]
MLKSQDPPGDTMIVISYAECSEEELDSYVPRVVHVNRDNEIVITDDTERELLS